MHSYARTLVVPRSRADVFRLLCDVAAVSAHRPDPSHVQVVTPRSFGLGTRWLETHRPRAGPFRLRTTTRCEVVVFEPPHHLVIHRSEGPRHSTLSFRLMPAGPRCRVEADAIVHAGTPRAARRWGRRLERLDDHLLAGLRERAARPARRRTPHRKPAAKRRPGNKPSAKPKRRPTHARKHRRKAPRRS